MSWSRALGDRMKSAPILLALVCLFGGNAGIAVEVHPRILALPRNDKERRAYELFLFNRYGFSSRDIRWGGGQYPVLIRGSDEAGFNPRVDCDHAPLEARATRDVIIVGGGPAGLSAAFFLNRSGKTVLLLEKEPVVGGLAVGSSLLSGGAYGRGGAYFTAPDGPLQKIYEGIGLSGLMEKMAIPEPIDSYYWNHRYYRGLWESEEALAELTADFPAFKYALQRLDDDGYIANQPLEDNAKARSLDRMSFADWTRRVPQELERRQAMGDREAGALLARLRADPRVDQRDPMRHVLGLLELYGRSALGDSAEVVSAAVFANFYISEIGVRYSSNLGAGGVTRVLWNQLKGRPGFVAKTGAAVSRLKNVEAGVEVCYVDNGSVKRVVGRQAVFAAPLKVAVKAIPELAIRAPRKLKLINGLEYRHYEVVNLHVLGHPWRDTYDLWMRDDQTYTKYEPTDLIEGRWMDFRGGELPRSDDRGVLTVYYPLPAEAVGQGFADERVVQIAQRAALKAADVINPLIAKRYPGQPSIQVIAVEANRWPFSIHVAKPGHFANQSKILAAPVGRIFFASNNIGAPSIDEAVYRGYQAANAILRPSATCVGGDEAALTVGRASCSALPAKVIPSSPSSQGVR